MLIASTKTMIRIILAVIILALFLPSGPPSSRGILSPALFTCLHDFAYVRRWTYLD